MKNILLMLFATAAIWAVPGFAQQVTVVHLKTKGAGGQRTNDGRTALPIKFR